MNEIWLEIVGFPNYLINIDTLEVKSILRGHILKIDMSNQVTLKNDEKYFKITPARLLFCAMNRIPPKEVPSDILIVIENGRPKVYNRSEYLCKKRSECKKTRAVDIDPLRTYREERDFIDKVIVSLETGDMIAVFSEIYKHRKGIVSYLINQRLVSNKNVAQEIASCSMEMTIEHILKGKIVSIPSRYLRITARFLALKVKRENKKQREYFDNIAI